MIDYINRTRHDHIITIEDPIEFVHQNKKCLINQREVRTHTDSFKDALRAALREDPDIMLVGELRDLETVAIAIETAETGHLVFGTLHTTTAASTVDRIIDQFPADRQAQIRIMLSESLRGVIAQTLCRKIGGGRVAALEVLIATRRVSNLIREGKTFQIPSIMQVNKAIGMVSLNDALMELVTKKLVAPDEAYAKAVDKAGFEVAAQANRHRHEGGRRPGLTPRKKGDFRMPSRTWRCVAALALVGGSCVGALAPGVRGQSPSGFQAAGAPVPPNCLNERQVMDQAPVEAAADERVDSEDRSSGCRGRSRCRRRQPSAH